VDALPAEAGTVELSGDAAHHLLRVVGVAPGEAVELYTAGGLSVVARLDRVAGGRARLETEAAPAAVEGGAPERWLLLARLKGPAFDTALRMATELGVTRILPVQAARSVARGDKRPRWGRVVASAVQQCGRAKAPLVDPPRGLAEALGLLPEGMACFVCVPGADRVPVGMGDAAVLIGPEGGWTEAEVALAADAGAQRLGLGRWVLRADTAAAAALARLA
jgi:16S rRNA (uracil1498-N3)-methyltransferase